MKLTATAVGLCVTAALLAGCGGERQLGERRRRRRRRRASTSTAAPSPWRSRPTPGTWTRSAAGSALFTLSQLAYDSLVSVDAESGAIESQLATDWTVDGTTVTLTLADGVTCADGSELHADGRRRQHRLRRRPEEQEPLPRHVPPGRRHGEGRRRRRHGDDHAGRPRAVRAQRPGQPADGLRRGHGRPQVAGAGHGGHRTRTSSPRPRPATTTPTRSATATPGARTARRPRPRACPTRSS